jgi:cation diffusion facilitator family transporter
VAGADPKRRDGHGPAEGGHGQGESRTTVIFALVANLVIAVAKLVGGVISGSSAMLAEGAHSLADTANQIMLLASLALGGKAPDEQHPFGHGRDRFFWAFMCAVFMFVGGAVFSVYEGLHALLGDQAHGEGSFLIPYVVLGLALVAESVALTRAYRHLRGEARQRGRAFGRHVSESREPTVKFVLFEDAAAVAGVTIALAGVALHQITGSPAWDGVASVLIGILLAIVAVVLGRDLRGLLLGEAAQPEERRRIREIIERRPEVEHLVELLTMVLGPDEVLVTARVDVRDGVDSAQVERMANELDEELRRALPAVAEVFLDPTPRARHGARRAGATA